MLEGVLFSRNEDFLVFKKNFQPNLKFIQFTNL